MQESSARKALYIIASILIAFVFWFYVNSTANVDLTINDIPVEFLNAVPEDIRSGDTFLVLNSQLDAGLVALARQIQQAGLRIGEDVFIVSYNESDMNELVLGGLTTVSTDFREMGRLAAEMVLSHRLTKEHCPFHMNRRRTF